LSNFLEICKSILYGGGSQTATYIIIDERQFAFIVHYHQLFK
jgi:hypothetical protein